MFIRSRGIRKHEVFDKEGNAHWEFAVSFNIDGISDIKEAEELLSDLSDSITESTGQEVLTP